ncbi:MAG TPA: ferredoxin family protein [Candidatus Baltobacteraceae bacterium]
MTAVNSRGACLFYSASMAYVITDPCIGTKDRSCVDVCPVDCIHGDDADEMLYIDPEVCIDCGACVSACPVEAIFADTDVPEKWARFAEINAAYFRKDAEKVKAR